MYSINQVLTAINAVVWHQFVIILLLVIGILYTIWSRFCQYRSLTHGVSIVLGKYDDKTDPGAISHFQALSTALSATVGVGNIGGTALAIAMGGPGALFWMWVVGLLGMALKTTEVTIALMYRKTVDGSVHGGAMWVIEQNLQSTDGKNGEGISKTIWFFGKAVACLFCVTLLIATFTGGLFFQAWNASNVTSQFFGIPALAVGFILATIVGLVILGGIERIGTVASRIVPFMCGTYLVAGLYVIAANLSEVPSLFGLIFSSAFSTSDSQGAFLGGTMGAIFSIGMRQAFFSNEAGQGSSPIVHSAAKTDQPVREGLVAGLEPFIDTIVVCTLTGMVILTSGVWNRTAEFELLEKPIAKKVDGNWQFEDSLVSNLRMVEKGNSEQAGEKVDSELEIGDRVTATIFTVAAEESSVLKNLRAPALQALSGTFAQEGGQKRIQWQIYSGSVEPKFANSGIFRAYDGASLTAYAFEQTQPGLGKWLVTLATWLFGISTMISWSYYGEQGVRYLFGLRFVTVYRVLFCLAILVSCSGIIQSRAELTNLVNLGTGVMLWVNVPITLVFASKAMKTYRSYFQQMES